MTARSEPRHARARYHCLRIVDPIIDGFDTRFRELADFAVLQKARPQRTEAQLPTGELMAGVAVPTILGPRRIVGEPAAVSRLGKILAFLPVAHELAVGRVFDRRLLACNDRFRYRPRRVVSILTARCHRLILCETRLPLWRRFRPALLHCRLHTGRIDDWTLCAGRRGGQEDDDKSNKEKCRHSRFLPS